MIKRQTQYQDNDTALSVMVRVGSVTAVDNVKRIARVLFPDMGLTSDWLPVLINRDFIPDYDEDPQHTEDKEGGSGYAAYEKHHHDLVIKPWMPKVNEQVLCLYEPVRNGRGFILGGIKPWK